MSELTTQSKCFDNTRLSAYKFCPRSFFLRHILHWTRSGSGDALVFGSSWHAGMDVLWQVGSRGFKPLEMAELAHEGFLQCWEENGYDRSPSMEMQERLGMRTPGVAKEMLFNYATERKRILQESKVFAIEQPFAVPIPDVEDIWYIGKLDKGIQWNQNKVVIEHKTTSDYRVDGGFNPAWKDSWFSSSQVKGYEFGAGLYYPNLDGVWVDGALVHKKVHDKFTFIPIKHQLPMLVEWLGDTKKWITLIERDTDEYNAKGNLSSGCFQKNEDSCYGKYGACPFLDICNHVPDPSRLDGPPMGYKEEVWEPFKVLMLDKLIKQDKEDTSEIC